MYTLFISDLHLDPGHPELTAIFLNFLNTQARQADALYILGDFFEVWLGDDDQNAFTATLSHALKALTQSGVPVYLMAGNRDFLLGQGFAQPSGCQLLADPTVIDLYGTPTLLMHGDILCAQDTDYLRFRRFVRNPVIQWLFLSLPLFIRRKIAAYLRKQSSLKTDSNYLRISDATEAAIQQAIRDHQAELLIHGHTHRPCLELHYANLPFKRIVLSDWGGWGNALIYQPDQLYRLVYFSGQLA